MSGAGCIQEGIGRHIRQGEGTSLPWWVVCTGRVSLSHHTRHGTRGVCAACSLSQRWQGSCLCCMSLFLTMVGRLSVLHVPFSLTMVGRLSVLHVPLSHHGREAVCAACPPFHHGRTAGLCAEVSSTHGENSLVYAQKPLTLGRTAWSMRRDLSP